MLDPSRIPKLRAKKLVVIVQNFFLCVSNCHILGQINPVQILSLLSSLQGGEGNGRGNAASLLQGLGTLLAGNGGENQGKFSEKL